jgi:urease accessory protein
MPDILNINSSWLPSMLQIFDSAFPTGGYAHSFGLEGLVQSGIVSDESSFETFLQTDVYHSLSRVDLPIFRLAYESYITEDFMKLTKLDDLAYASKATSEIRQASSRIGKQFLILIEKTIDNDQDRLDECALIKNHLSTQQITVVMGAACAVFKLPLAAALNAYATKTIHAFGQASIKLLNFGPYQMQKIMFRQQETIINAAKESITVPVDMIGSNSPRWDLASALHERSETRLFIS